MEEIIKYIAVALLGVGLISLFCYALVEAYASSKAKRNKQLNTEFQERMSQLEEEYRQRNALLDQRETELLAREKRQALWMETFQAEDCNIQKSTQTVINFHHGLIDMFTPQIESLERLQNDQYIPNHELRKLIREAIHDLHKQRTLLLSYSQTLASYLHHLGIRVQNLREQEASINRKEEQLIEDSPYIIEKALDQLCSKTDSVFYHRQAHFLNQFFDMVKDKRFHRAMIQDVRYTTMPVVICRIKSHDKNHPAPYITSLSSCTCDDYIHHHKPCKHMLFLAYHTGFLLLNKEKLESSMQQYLHELREHNTK